eukprot:1432843-Rhodomonas_salina.2
MAVLTICVSLWLGSQIRTLWQVAPSSARFAAVSCGFAANPRAVCGVAAALNGGRVLKCRFWRCKLM